jgi:hypothetical protein
MYVCETKMKNIKLFFKSLFSLLTLSAVFSMNQLQGQNQIVLLNNFANNSWKSEIVNIQNQNDTIEDHLVREFNGAVTNLNGTFQVINNFADIKNYYQNTINPANWLALVNGVLGGWNSILNTNDSPRKWMRNLNLREIYRFKNFIINGNNNLVNNANYVADDLVKARSLTGAFWRVTLNQQANNNPILAVKAFSGMLMPGQQFINGTYRIYTCMHGFRYGNVLNNMAYYFVPYGVQATSVES